MTEREILLRMSDLTVSYGRVQVLWGVSLSVARGQVTSIIGANGAGKTTTLNAVAGVLKSNSGTIIFAGEDVTRQPSHARTSRHIALVPEGRQLWARMTVEENLLMGGFPHSVRRAAHSNLQRVYDAFPRLKERRSQLAGTLSGGEQQMCAIGRGLMAEPKLLMLDEPSLGLAPKIVDEIFEFIRRLSAQGLTVLLVAQNVNYALQVSNYAYLMETGRITLEGAPDQLRSNPHVQAAYLGSS